MRERVGAILGRPVEGLWLGTFHALCARMLRSRAGLRHCEPEIGMLWERGKAYSQDLRERVFAAWDAGLRAGEIAEQLLVSVSCVSKVLGRERRTGERTVRPQRGHITPKLVAYHDAMPEHCVGQA